MDVGLGGGDIGGYRLDSSWRVFGLVWIWICVWFGLHLENLKIGLEGGTLVDGGVGYRERREESLHLKCSLSVFFFICRTPLLLLLLRTENISLFVHIAHPTVFDYDGAARV
jgi:hypothetical protein